jgi:hypothetical protein
MGCTTSVFLARKGAEVTLFEGTPKLMDGASRWNEGKVHLGYLYAADPSLSTAARVLPGGLAFKALIEQLLEVPITAAVTQEDDFYLLHPDSVVEADEMNLYFQRVSELVAQHHQNGDYLAPLGKPERLSRFHLDTIGSDRIQAGFRVPERSVRTAWIADRLVEAVNATSRVTALKDTRVQRVDSVTDSWNGPWRIQTNQGTFASFDVVVNALWGGRLEVDVASGLDPAPGWSHRFRLSLFLKTREKLSLPSVVLAAGPFGDVKNYDGHNFYASWYPVGLLAEGTSVRTPDIPPIPDPDAFSQAVAQGLSRWIPNTTELFRRAESAVLGGGWVFARGQGSLADRQASLHLRDRFGVERRGTYFSVDSGKYSTAPWLGHSIAHEICCS